VRPPFYRIGAAALAAVLTILVNALAPSVARASGTVTIQQAGGHTDVYNDVVIKVIHGALFMTSADGKGTLIIQRAACAYQGQLLVCFATGATLVQAGKTSPLDFQKGTLYVNSTDDPQQMLLTTTKVPPHSIVFSFTTSRGTYVNLSGRIDKVVQ